MKKHPILRNLLIDAVCAGLALILFALFHHVLPRQQQALQITVPLAADSGESTAAPTARPTARPTSRPTDRATAQPTARPTAAPTATPEATDAPTARSRGNTGWNTGGSTGRNTGGTGNTGWNNGYAQKGGSALTDDGEETTHLTDGTPLSEKFTNKYTDTVIITENSYSSPDLSITVTEETLNHGRIIYYLADIYVRDIACFQTALAKNTFGSDYRDSIADMAALHNALLAVNGDYYGNTNEGVVIRNGVIYRANPTDCDVCVLYADGTMRVMAGSAFSVDEAVQDGAWQAWTFGPALLDEDGSVLTSFSSTSRIISANPRTAIGYWEPGHYCLVVVDGRGESAGISLPELSQLFYDLGCTAAYNLDGGNSSVMVWQNTVVNDPSGGGRESSDALLIAEVKQYE